MGGLLRSARYPRGARRARLFLQRRARRDAVGPLPAPHGRPVAGRVVPAGEDGVDVGGAGTAVVFGSGPAWAGALEAALLLKEVSGVPAEGVETREGATSAMMALGPGSLALSLSGKAEDPLLAEAEEICAGQGAVVVRTPHPDTVDRRLAAIFPGLGPLEWEHRWTGWVGMTYDLNPHLHELAPGLWAALGYSGRGIALTSRGERLRANLDAHLGPLVEAALAPATFDPATAERTLRLTTVVGQWEQDLMSLYDSATVPALQFDGATMRLTRFTPEGAQVVVWSLREGVWQRWASPSVRRAFELQQAWMTSQQLIGTEDRQVRLFDNASEWQVYFYRGNAWTNAQSSGDVIPAAPPPALAASGVVVPRTALPSGVRLVIQLGERRLTRDIMLGPTHS